MDIKELEKPLNRDNVKERENGRFKLSYIEGWFAISEANRIFGFDSWYRETVYCKEVCRYEYEGKNKTHMWKVGYEACVKVTIHQNNGSIPGVVIREGTGHGSGNARDLFDCIEGAAKEAETDAMKRALMTFGNPFGLALYDKTQANVASQQQMAIMAAIDAHQSTITAIKDGIATNDFKMASEAWKELNNNEKESIWVAPSNGGAFTTEERKIMQSTEFREAGL